MQAGAPLALGHVFAISFDFWEKMRVISLEFGESPLTGSDLCPSLNIPIFAISQFTAEPDYFLIKTNLSIHLTLVFI